MHTHTLNITARISDKKMIGNNITIICSRFYNYDVKCDNVVHYIMLYELCSPHKLSSHLAWMLIKPIKALDRRKRTQTIIYDSFFTDLHFHLTKRIFNDSNRKTT